MSEQPKWQQAQEAEALGRRLALAGIPVGLRAAYAMRRFPGDPVLRLICASAASQQVRSITKRRGQLKSLEAMADVTFGPDGRIPERTEAKMLECAREIEAETALDINDGPDVASGSTECWEMSMPTVQELTAQAADDHADNYYREHGSEAIQVLVQQINESNMSKPDDLKMALRVIARLDKLIRQRLVPC